MKLKIYTQVELETGITKIWLYNDESAKDEYFSYDGEYLVCTTRDRECISIADTPKIKPLMTLPHTYAKQVLEAFAEYADRNNIHTETKSFTDGKLEATQKHLENSIKIIDKLLEK